MALVVVNSATVEAVERFTIQNRHTKSPMFDNYTEADIVSFNIVKVGNLPRLATIVEQLMRQRKLFIVYEDGRSSMKKTNTWKDCQRRLKYIIAVLSKEDRVKLSAQLKFIR